MPKTCYDPAARSRLEANPGRLTIIERANAIIDAYQAQGFDLTLRQLYYQFVSRDWIANKQSEYKRLGEVIQEARMAGMVDWEAIVDRTRFLRELSRWDDPSAIIEACASQFRIDVWEGQTYRPEVWIEKDALVGVIEGVCQRFQIPFFSCRGYTSASEVWGAAQRLRQHIRNEQTPIILHFGDHDPSGIDMTRDIEKRLRTFGCPLKVRRLALNMDQIEQYQPPPNPAKEKDSRYAGYIQRFGDESWELDALEPRVLTALIETTLNGIIDRDEWRERQQKQAQHREQLAKASERWPEITDWLEDN